MRLVRLIAAISSTAALAACAAPTEQTDDTSSAIAVLPAMAECKADGNMRKGPSTSSPVTTTVGAETLFFVYCKEATAGEGTWVEAKLRDEAGYKPSFVSTSILESCTTTTHATLGVADAIASLPACPASSLPAGAPSGRPAPIAPIGVPAGAHVLFEEPPLVGGGNGFSSGIDWTSAAHAGIFTLGAVWNGYDASGKLAAAGTCPAFSPSSTELHGSYACYAHDEAPAVTFHVVYYATGPSSGLVSRAP